MFLRNNKALNNKYFHVKLIQLSRHAFECLLLFKVYKIEKPMRSYIFVH